MPKPTPKPKSEHPLKAGTKLSFLHPSNGEWVSAIIEHHWQNTEYAVRFPDKAFTEPLTYDLSQYQFEVLSPQKPRPERRLGIGMAMANAVVSENEEVSREDMDGEFEVEAIIDVVEIGGPPVYRVKWKGYGLGDCTWEPAENLDKALAVVKAYDEKMKGLSEDSEELLSVRATSRDRAMLYQLWDVLQEKRLPSVVQWYENGQAFTVLDTGALARWMRSEECVLRTAERKDFEIDIRTYRAFAHRLAVLGFEQREEENEQLFHHPCFTKDGRERIAQIGNHCIPVPEMFQIAPSSVYQDGNEREDESFDVKEEKRGHRTKTDSEERRTRRKGRKRRRDEDFDEGSASSGKRRRRHSQVEMGGESQSSSTSAAGAPPPAQLNVRIPPEANLNLNECHLWSEDHVATWLNYMGDWGSSYVQAFVDNGVDGRILLEFDIETVCSECGITSAHKPQFILAVNQLRTVRSRCLGLTT